MREGGTLYNPLKGIEGDMRYPASPYVSPLRDYVGYLTPPFPTENSGQKLGRGGKGVPFSRDRKPR